jgi:hypothetical protein
MVCPRLVHLPKVHKAVPITVNQVSIYIAIGYRVQANESHLNSSESLQGTCQLDRPGYHSLEDTRQEVRQPASPLPLPRS